MRNKVWFILVLVMCAVTPLLAKPRKKKLNPKQLELNSLKARLESARDSLQNEIANRWKKKQKYVSQREVDKEELIQLRDDQEQSYLELSRVKEECYNRENKISDERRNLDEKKERWRYVATTLEGFLEKEAEQIIEIFPIDRETRRLDLESIRRDYEKDTKAIVAYKGFMDYKFKYLSLGSKITLSKHSVITDNSDNRELMIARFGHVFGYGMSSENQSYVIRQTGRLGMNRFSIEEIGQTDLATFLAEAYPKWVQAGVPSGTILTDVLQNAQSSELITGVKTTFLQAATKKLKAGGPVMIPLMLLPLWALVLILLKILQLSSKHRSGENLSQKVLAELDKGDIAKARDIATKKKGLVSEVVVACLDHSEWDREAAEQAVDGILIKEVPLLNKHMGTLAVIAGVAPLLGLLGTVTGMINLFEVITHYGTGDPKIMAGGISEALITTQTGLSIAIPILLVHNYLRNRKDDIKAEMEKHAIQILNKLWPSGTKA